jgi:hypothetical protein
VGDQGSGFENLGLCADTDGKISPDANSKQVMQVFRMKVRSAIFLSNTGSYKISLYMDQQMGKETVILSTSRTVFGTLLVQKNR